MGLSSQVVRFTLPPRVLNHVPEAKRTRWRDATEFLVFHAKSAPELTSWFVLARGSRRVVASCPVRPSPSNWRSNASTSLATPTPSSLLSSLLHSGQAQRNQQITEQQPNE